MAAVGAVFGKYEVLSRIGVGGMGEVFRARVGGRQVALKLIRPELATESRFRRMFLDEGQVASRLDHPQIVRTLDFGEVDQVPFLVTELVEGAALDQVMAQGSLSLAAAAHVVGELLAALAYAHALTDERGRPLGLVHRDVSPQNVLLSRAGEVKLADFGVVKLDGQKGQTVSHELKGKLGYIAPERLESRGGVVDRRADLFSVGVLLHELVLGRRPFEDLEAWIAAGAPLTSPGPLTPAGPLGALLERALALEPEDRFADAGSFAAALAALVPRAADGRAELAARVTAVGRSERPLGELERRIMAELAPFDAGPGRAPALGETGVDEPSVLIYAPDPSTNRLWIARAATQLAPHHDERPTDPWGPGPGRGLTDLDLSDAGLETLERPPFEAIAFELSGPTPAAVPSWRLRRRVLVRLASATALLVVTTWLVAFGGQGEPAPPEPTAARPTRTPVVRAAAVAPAPAPIIPAAPPAELPRKRSAEAAPAPRPVRAAPRPRPAAEGLLSLDSEPWATVYLGGRRLGITPFLRVPVPAGALELSFDVQGSGRRVRKQVEVAPGQLKRLMVQLP